MKVVLIVILLAGLGIVVLPYVFFRQPPMPEGTNVSGELRSAKHLELLVDRTSWEPDAVEPMREHAAFDAVLEMIDRSETFLLLDFFLWNPWKGGLDAGSSLRPLSTQLADALLRKRTARPEMPILFITDPINRAYGDHAPEFFDRLAEAGIPVVFVDLQRLPDSNLVYAPFARFWKPVLRHLRSVPGLAGAGLPNPFDSSGRDLTLGEAARLLRFKANHRKVVVAGREGGEAELWVGSLNPADGSANHSNLALRVGGPVAFDALRSELSVAGWSLKAGPRAVHGGLMEKAGAALELIAAFLPAVDASPPAGNSSTGPRVAWRSEGAIRDEIVGQLDRAGEGDVVSAGLFYLSDRKAVEAIKGAARRGARVRILLDANRDAFGRKKNGVPNRPVASELMRLSDDHDIEVRWAATNGEQFHGKALRIRGPGGGPDVLLVGSANWTRRNLANLNLEANLLVERAGEAGLNFDRYFESVWTNGAGRIESLPYEDVADAGFDLFLKGILYRIQEASGASTF